MKFTYGTGGNRDKVTQQDWPATGESGMTFTYSDLTHVTVVDALKQSRVVTLTDVVANPGVPTISVDGKYLVAIVSNVDFAKQLAVVDALIAKARSEKRK